jgi:hypothetical protein
MQAYAVAAGEERRHRRFGRSDAEARPPPEDGGCPMSVSWVGLVIAALLSIWGFVQ